MAMTVPPALYGILGIIGSWAVMGFITLALMAWLI
jgi:hypothetical protein